MALIGYTITVVAKQDNPYNVLPETDISIRKNSDNTLVNIYADEAGLIPIAQLGAKTDSNGRFTFYADASLGILKAVWTNGGSASSEILDGGDHAGLRNRNAVGAHDAIYARQFASVYDMTVSAVDVGLAVSTRGYYDPGDGGAASYIINPIPTTPHPALDHTMDSGLVAVYQHSNDHVNCKQAGIFPDGNDYTSKWLQLVDLTGSFPNRVNRIYCPSGTYQLELFKSMPKMEIYGDGALSTIFELSYTGSYSVVMGQVGTDCYIHDLQLSSTEADLDQQRTSIESRSTLERCIFQGFRDVTGATDAWGIYLKSAKDVRVIQCGFDNNTQSDIAIVDDCSGILIDGCYGLGSTFHVNIEPNVITTRNRAITIANMQMSKLSLIETTGGGTANNIKVQSVRADVLYYAGARVSLDSCEFISFANGGTLWFGELKLNNSMSIGENLLTDPYMSLVGINTTEATTNGYSWAQGGVSGSFTGTDTSSTMVENGFRFTRLNPSAKSGQFQWRNINSIPVTSGGFILVVVTGRFVSGTSDAFIRVNDGSSTTKVGRIFRQGDLNSPFFSTEMCIIPITTTGSLTVEIGLPQTHSGVVDIASVSVHKILSNINGRGGNATEVIRRTHSKTGPRTTEWSSLPIVARSIPNGIQIKDRVTVGIDDYIYDGALAFKKVTTT